MRLIFDRLKRLMVGHPLRTSALAGEKLSNLRALAVFSSDALSSVAYATEETLNVLVAASLSAATGILTPIAGAILALLAILTISYRQVIFAYPDGGGSYVVAKENLGATAGLVAAAALMVDYALTVAVSVSAGVDAVISAVPAFAAHRVGLALLVLAVLTLINLRGLREAGLWFAVPTYAFIVMTLTTIVVDLVGSPSPLRPLPEVPSPHVLQSVGWIIVLRAFSSGCTALTGVEAISNGVPVFKEPAVRRAAQTLLTMAAILGVMFAGISYLAERDHILPQPNQTILSQLGHEAFGHGPLYYALQLATMLILSLAANTSFNGFPILTSILARDRYLPRQLAHRGDRLAFSNGIVVLSVIAGALLLLLHAQTTRLIPLYAVGVFLSFSLAQTGMVRRWLSARNGAWRWGTAVNGFGALTTAIVLAVIAVSKFAEGAWAVVVVIPICVGLFRAVERNYRFVARSLSLDSVVDPQRIRNRVIVPVSGLTRVSFWAMKYAKTLSTEVRAVQIAMNEAEAQALRERWTEYEMTVPLVQVISPYRTVMKPLIDFIDEQRRHTPEEDRLVYTVVTVVIPEFIPGRWWQATLHNQFGLRLKAALLFRPGVLVTSVPYHLSYRADVLERTD